MMGKFTRLQAFDISYTHALTENAIYQFLQAHAPNLRGLVLCGKPALTENFWLNVIPYLKNIRYTASHLNFFLRPYMHNAVVHDAILHVRGTIQNYVDFCFGIFILQLITSYFSQNKVLS